MKQFFPICFLFCLVSVSTPLYSQIEIVDSLLQQLDLAKEDTTKLVLFEQIGRAYRSVNPQKSIQYLDEGIALAEKGDAYFYLSNLLSFKGVVLMYNLRKHEKAKNTYIENLRVIGLLKKAYPEKLANAYLGLGRAYGILQEVDSSLKYYEKAIPVFKSLQNLSRVAQCNQYIGSLYSTQEKGEQALVFYTKAIQYAENGVDPKTEISSVMSMASVFFKLMQLQKAEVYYKKVIRLGEKYGNNKYFPIAVSSLANIYKRLGMDDKALIYLQKSLESSTKLGSKYGVATALQNLGSYYLQKSNREEVEKHYREALGVLASIRTGEAYFEYVPIIKAQIFQDLSVDAIETGNMIQAEKYIDKALAIANRYGAEKLRIDCYYLSGRIYKNQRKYDLSIVQYKRSLALKQADLFGYLNPRILTAIGEVYALQHQYDSALVYFQKAIQSEFKGFGLSNLYENPKIEDLYVNDYFVKMFFWKANCLQQRFQSEHKLSDIVASVDTYDWLIDILEIQRQKFQGKNAKNKFSEANFPVYKRAIKASLIAYEATGEKKYLEKAFVCSEKSKSSILLEKLLKVERQVQTYIPDSLKLKEREIAAKQTVYEKKIFKLMHESATIDSAQLFIYRDRLFHIQQEKDQLLAEIKTHYPAYYQVKYDFEVASISQIRDQLLESDKGLIEYFVADSTLYTFVVTQDTFRMESLQLDFPLYSWIDSLRICTYGYQLSTNKTDALYKELQKGYEHYAHQLYRKLLAPLGKLPTKLIIIPDGVLAYVSFDALLMQAPDEKETYRNYAYVLKQHQLSYGYSTRLLINMKRIPIMPQKGVLAMAPTFEAEETQFASVEELRRDGLGPLVFNQPEVNFVTDLMSGRALLGKEATEDRFSLLAPQYNIIHLSSHGKFEDRNPDYSFLAFTEIEDTLENERLYVRELYNMRLNAELVVLSACETGIGHLQKGEGIESLARGFAYAGAKSLLTTLWQVNDEASLILMKAFYTHLNNGKPKDEALRLAKLDYIHNANIREAKIHPFFWSAFIAMGDMKPIGSPHSDTRWMWMFGIFVLGVVGIMYYLFRRKAKKDMTYLSKKPTWKWTSSS